jgi:hypothetical protein
MASKLFPPRFTLTIDEHPASGWVVTSDAHKGFTQTIMPEEGLPEGLRRTPALLRQILVAQADADREGDDQPSVLIPLAELEAGIPLFRLLPLADLAVSWGEARRLVRRGAVLLNGHRTTDEVRLITLADLRDGTIKIKVGLKPSVLVRPRPEKTAPQNTDWRPIETAPKDRPIDLWAGGTR